MKNLATVMCCFALAIFGALVAFVDTSPTNTANAQSAPLNLVMGKDTVEVKGDTVRDTVPQVKYKVKYKVKQAPCAVCSSASATDSSACGNRKAISPDTLPTKLYRIHGTIEQVDESKHDSYAGKE